MFDKNKIKYMRKNFIYIILYNIVHTFTYNVMQQFAMSPKTLIGKTIAIIIK